MGAPFRFCQQADLENAAGGAAVLVQWLDKDGDGIADKNLVDDAIEAGCGDIAGKIARTVDLASLQQPYPTNLVKQSARRSAFYAAGMGGDGQAIPPHIITFADNALTWAQRVADRQDGLGDTPRPSLDPPATQIDPDPNGQGISVNAFKRAGFR